MDDANAPSHSWAPPQSETSSKAKKRKTLDEKDMEQIMVAIQDMATTMREEKLTFERSFARLPIPKKQVFCLIDDIGIEPWLQTPTYLYLVRNPGKKSNSKYCDWALAFQVIMW